MMHPQQLYLIKGKPYSNVLRVENAYFRGRRVYSVTFKGKDSCYVRNYALHDVASLPFVQTVSGDIRYKEELSGRIGLTHFVHIYGKPALVYGVEQGHDFTKYYTKSEISLESSIRGEKNKLLFYLERIAALSRISDSEGNIISLADKYTQAKFIFKGSLFAKYLNPEKATLEYNRNSPFLVFPFGCNETQFNAVNKALTNDLSVIQGPPGTGKTQTILNIIANLVIQGKSTQIVSNNNSAVENIAEKLEQYGYDFLFAFLGRLANKETFFINQTGQYPDIHKWQRSKNELKILRERVTSIVAAIPKYFEYKEVCSSLRNALAEYDSQSKHFDIANHRLPRVSSKKLFSILLRMEDEYKRLGRLSLKTKFFLVTHRLKGMDRNRIEALASEKRYIEQRNKLQEMDNWCQSFEPNYNQFISLSRTYFEAILYEKYGSSTQRNIYSKESLFGEKTLEFLSDYPIILSTTFSATTNIDRLIPFDMLIMDEASQIDVSAGALALNCANAAVIVGDEKQLPNVVPDDIRKEADRLLATYDIGNQYRFYDNSFLNSIIAVFPDMPQTLLREHYRCEPRIIEFCNKMFYGGQLIPMTQRSNTPSMSIIRTVMGNHARGKVNVRQAEECVSEAKRLAALYKSIGVITPYNDQVRLIDDLFRKEGLKDIRIATVHKFQGREEDAIILCTVDNEIKEFIDDPHLLNVAVSRAKNHFSLIVNGNDMPDSNIKKLADYIAYCGGNVMAGSVRSVFDLLYDQYSKEREVFVKSKLSISQYLSENIITNELNVILQKKSYSNLKFLFQYPLSLLVSDFGALTKEEIIYAKHDWTRCDFLVYDIVTKKPILVIEVDGMSFHKEGSEQWQRDRKKDSILAKSGIHLLRLPTTGSREKEKIEKALDEAQKPIIN